MAMTLNETQRQQVADWLAAGAKLSEIQNRLAAEFGLRLTYMEVRLLVDDLKLTPKDAESLKPATPIETPPGMPPPSAISEGGTEILSAEPPPGLNEGETELLPRERSPGTGGVSVVVDQLARPGAIVSGRVNFSDGQQADWYLDQTGRLGIVPKQQGYQPSRVDLQEFQMALQDELAKLGF